MKTIYLYVLDTMADWEVGYAIAELSSQRYFRERQSDWQVKACATGKKPIVTMGGMTIAPDCALEEVDAQNAIMLILPGADTWLTPTQAPILAKARAFLGAQVPVAAICGATGALAQAGMLDKIKHTSNGLAYLHRFCPQYAGAKNYQDELAVTDGNLITAGSSSPVEFAHHIFKKLNVFESADLEHWYDYFAKHSTASLMKLLGSTQNRMKESSLKPLERAG
jgi:putative intracellular protease/amidase